MKIIFHPKFKEVYASDPAAAAKRMEAMGIMLTLITVGDSVFFNNIAVALAKLKAENKIKRAFILDIDLHLGYGTADIFAKTEFRYFHPEAYTSEEFIKLIKFKLKDDNYDILAISAGFDRGIEDWGGLLSSADYYTIGRLTRKSAEKISQGRRFAVLEGGYNHKVLGKDVKAFVNWTKLNFSFIYLSFIQKLSILKCSHLGVNSYQKLSLCIC